jgi:hypothetical protein
MEILICPITVDLRDVRSEMAGPEWRADVSLCGRSVWIRLGRKILAAASAECGRGSAL